MTQQEFNTQALSFPLDVSDAVRLTIYAIGVGQSYTATARIRLDSGKIVPFQQSFPALTINTTNVFMLPLPAGDLIAFSLKQTSVQPGRSEAYAYLDILLNSNIPTSPSLRLTQGYIGAQQALVWPYTDPNQTDERTLSQLGLTAAPAAGANAFVTAASGISGMVLGFSCTLTTDANVANRQLQVVANGMTGNNVNFVIPIVQTASLARNYAIFPGASVQTVGAINTAPMPEAIRLPFDTYFGISVLNIQAGDQLTNIEVLIEQFTN
jgi:hypothetical protein